MPRLLILRSSLRLGGIERQLLDHVLRLTAGGWQVDLVCLLREEGEHPLAAAAHQHGLSAVTVYDPGPLHPRTWRWLHSWLRRERPDLVHTCDYRCDVLAFLAARGLPRIAESHGHTQESRTMRLWNACDFVALRHADAVVCVSGAWETRLAVAGVPAGRLHIAGNTTAILPDGPPPALAALPQGRHLLFAGRLSPEKGIDWLLAAWPELRDSFPDLHLWVAGDLPKSGGVRRHLLAGLQREAVYWLGYQPDIRPWLLAVDAVIAPSRQEAWGMTVFEALAAGVPVVAARIGGLPQVCSQAPHALLFKPGSIPSLIDSLRTVLNPDFPRGSELGLGYRSQRRFDPESRTQVWLRLYAQLADRAVSPAAHLGGVS